jgi:hypothetical protein
MTDAENATHIDFIHVEENYEVQVIEAYLKKEIKLTDLTASLGLKRDDI